MVSKTTLRKIEKHLDAENKRRRDMRLSKNPNIAKLELQALNLVARVKKEGLSG